MILNCLIVDDEPLARKLVQEYAENFPFINIIGVAKNAFEAIDFLQKTHIDLIFLDIQMPGMLGTQFVNSLSFKPKVIFITAYSNYALESYELDVIDYLMKPVSIDRFTKAVNKALERFQLAEPKQLEVNAETKDHFFANVEYALVKIVFDEITHIEGLKDYVKIFIVGRPRPILTKSTLKGIEEKLPQKEFYRVHKSFIVNLKKIQSIKAQRIKIDTHDIPISEANFDQLMSMIM